MHPFLNTRGLNRDHYQVLRTLGPKQKKSAHVSYGDLIEMFAHECFEEFNIRLRMKPSDGTYPGSPPALHPHRDDIVSGSVFARAVAAVDTRKALSLRVQQVLRQLGVQEMPARAS